MIIEVTHKGNFKNTENFLQKAKNFTIDAVLDKYGQEGVNALSAATPVDTGKTAASWQYKIDKEPNQVAIRWYNTNINKGVNIAVILQYGHGTGTGGWVEGRDYINPAMRPIFDKLANDAWESLISK